MYTFDSEHSGLVMMAMALGLGVRHGFDLDHLATIDAMARTVRSRPFFARLVGFLFSLGHGAVVVLVSAMIGSGVVQTRIPDWLGAFGSWVSILFLFLFGLLNLWSLFQGSKNGALPVGLKSFLVQRLGTKKFNPLMVLAVGALFAFSFDTFSQVALFSLSASVLSGWLFAALLGLCFMVGMMLSDGLNGLFVSLLIQKADRFSRLFSRALGLAITLFSLTLGALALYEQLF